MNTNNKTYCNKTGKKCYSSKEAAQAINLAHKSHKSNSRHYVGKIIPSRMYYCNSCDSFHLTSLKNFKQKKKAS